jgi:vacuolar-type H+-ATPase subunit H
MDYLLKAKIPMAMLTQNAAGAVATKGFGLLQGQASKIGVNLKQSEFANVNIKLLGSMKNPKVQMQLVNGEGKSVKDAVVDQAKEQVKAVVEDTKAKATEAATTIVKDTKEKATEIVKETTTKAKEEATKAVQDIVKGKPINQDSLKKAAEDLLKGAGTKGTGTVQDQVKAAKDNLDKLNPFKKKNK